MGLREWAARRQGNITTAPAKVIVDPTGVEAQVFAAPKIQVASGSMLAPMPAPAGPVRQIQQAQYLESSVRQLDFVLKRDPENNRYAKMIAKAQDLFDLSGQAKPTVDAMRMTSHVAEPGVDYSRFKPHTKNVFGVSEQNSQGAFEGLRAHRDRELSKVDD